MEMPLSLLNLMPDISEQDLASFLFHFQDSCKVDRNGNPTESNEAFKCMQNVVLYNMIKEFKICKCKSKL